MNWGLLALFAIIVAAIAVQNIWLRRRAEAEAPNAEEAEAEAPNAGETEEGNERS